MIDRLASVYYIAVPTIRAFSWV